jgi:GTP-binding protein YchF
MSLKCGIVGLSMTGKTTLFNCISNTRAQVSAAAFSAAKANLGLVNVPDTRLKELEKFQPTEKLVPATVEIVDIPGLTKSSGSGDTQANRFLADIRQTDAIIHVLRCFESDSIPHIEGSVDPVRDKEIVDFELQVKDLESVEKKLVKTERAAKAGDKEAKAMLSVLERCKAQLESFKPVRDLELGKEDRKAIEDLFLLTEKPVMYVCNVDEKSAIAGNAYVEKVKAAIASENTEMLVIAAALESEIAELEDENDRLAFLSDTGLTEPGVHKLVRSAYSFLQLQTFFTVGPKEIRAWTIHKGMTAPQAAGVIHSDLERGFIRAEVMKYDDFIKLGSEVKCKENGKFYVEGKNYVVGDGDILHIRFNV